MRALIVLIVMFSMSIASAQADLIYTTQWSLDNGLIDVNPVRDGDTGCVNEMGTHSLETVRNAGGAILRREVTVDAFGTATPYTVVDDSYGQYLNIFERPNGLRHLYSNGIETGIPRRGNRVPVIVPGNVGRLGILALGNPYTSANRNELPNGDYVYFVDPAAANGVAVFTGFGNSIEFLVSICGEFIYR